jgi:putative ABC transport system permease protein
MRILWQDIRYGLRMLARSPGFTAVVVLVLALGIGANTAIFTMTCSVLLSPLPFAEPQRIVFLNNESKTNGNRFSCSGPEYLDWAEQNTVFEETAALVPARVSLTGTGEPRALSTLRVTPGFFRTLGVEPASGRGFRPEEAETGNHHVTVLSQRLWKSAFGGAPDIIGREVLLDGVPATVIGVTRPTMGFIDDLAQLYTLLPREELQTGRTNRYLAVLGRLKPNTSVQQAQVQMNLVAERLAQEHPDSNKDIRVLVNSLREVVVKQVTTAFLVLHGAVALLLLIACANVSNLLLARSGLRAREMAVRAALGAGRVRLLRQMLTESVLLGLCGGGLGLVVAFWGLGGLKYVAPRLAATGGRLPGFDEIHLDSVVLGFTAGLSLLTAVIFGLIPARRTSGGRFRETLSENGYRMSAGLSRRRMLSGLVVAQIALALILLTGSGLLIRSFARLQHVNPGFLARGLLAVQLERPNTPASYENRQRAAFYQQAVEQLAMLPDVESVGAISLHPMASANYRTVFTIKDTASAVERGVSGEYRMITDDAFRCLRIPLLQGRYFASSDRAGGEDVAIVNQEFVRKSRLGAEVIGKSITIHGAKRTIVGVVANVKEFSLDEKDFEPTVYEPIHQNCSYGMTILLRTTQEPLRLAPGVRRVIREIDPDQPILRIQTMNQVAGDTTSLQRFSMVLFSLLGCVALGMAVAGLYALVTYAVNERAREIGIRLAFGAGEKDILRLAMRRAAKLVIAGLVLGLVGALCLTRCMASLLFEISATDAATFVLVPAILLATALLACYVPARRAARIDPMVALRYE